MLTDWDALHQQGELEQVRKERDRYRAALRDIIEDCPRMCGRDNPACQACQKAYAALPETTPEDCGI